MKATELPLLFVDQVGVGVLEGTGDSVQLTFSSPHAGDAVEQVPVVRIAMTRLSFVGLVALLTTVEKDLNKSTERPN